MAPKRRHNEGILHGDGHQWCRGPLVGESGSGPLIFLATLKKFTNCRQRILADRLRPVMTVKSAEASAAAASLSLIKEKLVLEDLQDCRHIRRIFGEETTVGEGGAPVYNLLLEYPSGGTLLDLMERCGGAGLSRNQVWPYTKCLLLGLAHLHGRGYVHRNLKTDSVILLRTGCNEFMAKIGDYESVTKADERLVKTLWRPYTRMNYEYLSPEAYRDGNQGPASDIWALGCIVHEMFTGKSVWDGKEVAEIKDELVKMKGGRGRIKIPKGVSKNGRQFLKCCFERDAESRWTAERLLRLPFFEGF